MAQFVNAIRGSATSRTGSIVMEHFSHQQNLAHCRRQLAEAELATSSDENQQPVGLFFGQEPHEHAVTYFIARGGKFSLGKLPSTMRQVLLM